MARSMHWSSLGLVVITVLPYLVPAFIFDRERLVGADDTSLLFEPRHRRQEGLVSSPQSEQSSSSPPSFCNKLDCPAFTVIQNKSTYQLREYVKSEWVSTSSVGEDYDEAQYNNFMRLFRYIGGKNVKQQKIKMTAPVINRILPGPGPACANNFTMSFFVSPKEGTPPKPSNEKVFLSSMAKMRVYVRSFSGFADKAKWLEQGVKLANDLEGKGQQYHKEFYYTAGYNSPFQLTNRHNEIWFIAK
ncbi:heme-binding protein 2-like [Babylonia areolata]|uniref:heme-binding protein 2-like n=1 Tax=Babylonia areolata TaxID=304850 RepID=UPI003FD12479